MSFDRACELCGRDSWVNRETGERKALEVCYSGARQAWACKRCHFDGVPMSKREVR